MRHLQMPLPCNAVIMQRPYGTVLAVDWTLTPYQATRAVHNLLMPYTKPRPRAAYVPAGYRWAVPHAVGQAA